MKKLKIKLLKVVTILTICVTCPALNAKIVIPTNKEAGYFRTLDRAEEMNKTEESAGVYIRCKAEGDKVRALKQYHKIFKQETFYFNYPVVCRVDDGHLYFKARVTKSFWESIWTPTTAFFIGLGAGVLVAIGLRKLLE